MTTAQNADRTSQNRAMVLRPIDNATARRLWLVPPTPSSTDFNGLPSDRDGTVGADNKPDVVPVLPCGEGDICCVAASIYALLTGACTFAVLRTLSAAVAVHRYRKHG